MSREDVLATKHQWLSYRSVQLCYFYKSKVVIHNYKIPEFPPFEQIHTYMYVWHGNFGKGDSIIIALVFYALYMYIQQEQHLLTMSSALLTIG